VLRLEIRPGETEFAVHFKRIYIFAGKSAVSLEESERF
jgi:hypothetical protein